MINLQKASFGKRIIAAIFDGILLSIIAVGLIALLSGIFKTDTHLNTYQEAYNKYSTEYNINLTANEYSELTEQQKTDYAERIKAFNNAINQDPEASYASSMFFNLTLLITTFSILISIIAIEFAVPLFFGNGQTLGKKIFGIALMHTEGIKVSNIQLFIRAVLGKFTIETMIPVYILMLIYFNLIGIISVAILAILLIAQIICLIATRTNSLLHDVLAGTVAVDMASQRIFESREALIEHTKKFHAQQANKPTY